MPNAPIPISTHWCINSFQYIFMFSGLLCLVAAGLVLRIARERPGPVEDLEPGVGMEAPAYS